MSMTACRDLGHLKLVCVQTSDWVMTTLNLQQGELRALNCKPQNSASEVNVGKTYVEGAVSCTDYEAFTVCVEWNP